MSDTILKDLVIIGAGPAGLSAAIYAQRALLDTVTLEQEAVGGQVILTSEIDNYPGVPHTDGYSLIEAMRQQAEDLGAAILVKSVTRVEYSEDAEYPFKVYAGETEYDAKTVILAGGATPRHAGFEGEEDFAGRGVSYCATCDGMFFRGKHVYVVGGGNSAAEEAMFLTRFAEQVSVVVRKDHLRAQAAVSKELETNPKVNVLYNTKVVSVDGAPSLTQITLKDTKTGVERLVKHSEGAGVFVFVGRVPASETVRGLVDITPAGYVAVDARMATRTPGLFAAGDVCDKPLRQIVTAVSDGAIAATSVSAYLGHPVEG